MPRAIQLDLLQKPSGRTSILTASGFVLDLANPDATGLPVEDVARALAFQPRWCGATSAFYSVAEHSVMVSRLVPEPLAYSALWHDSIEFVQGDWPSPLKVYLGRDEINRKLAPLEAALARRFGFRSHLPEVKRADLVAMATELRDLLPPAWMDWGHLPPPAAETIRPVGPERACALFLERYEQLRHLAEPAGQPPSAKRKTGGRKPRPGPQA
ncbi:5'-deoxynucleotidase YfbR-like HD superfamily hydrolase [Azospirillum agricola]|uniref:hydrolase n=1 Tax=Azospirillum agricola TaxID=1720247 RepID=UPI001AE3DC30|nr:hydrolase [Azospirillum agricola]MBP2227735.1 5'-deoxynucleotidase YfbR-like HD superfamily hydrolase [Azospirillum agricola]